MAEAAYIETIRGAHFSAIPKDKVVANTNFHEIEAAAGSNFFLDDHVFNSNQGKCMLDEVPHITTLTQWLTMNETIDSRLFYAKVFVEEPLHQIARPTKKGLAMIRALLKTVGLFHESGSALSYPVEFGVNVPADEQNDPEYEIAIKQGAAGRLTIRQDLEYMKDLIFNRILCFPKFINCDPYLCPPRLPAGLMELEDIITTSSLNQSAKHYSVFDWEYQKEILKVQFDRGCETPLALVNWISEIPPTGIVHKFLKDQPRTLTTMGKPVGRYRETKGDLLRFMRHFFNHLREHIYSFDANEPLEDFKNDEYVICVFSEIFVKYYWRFSL